MNQMEDGSNIEGCISLGPWGGETGGEPWSYMPNGYNITKVTIRYSGIPYSGAIKSILFESVNHETGQIEHSKHFGGPGGDTISEFCIDTPVEELESLEITLGNQTSNISSLTFRTNVATYGPFPSGTKTGRMVINRMAGGMIAGFHGRAKTYIDSDCRAQTFIEAIGIYVVPKRCYFTPTHQIQETHHVPGRDIGFMKLALPRDIGPWGSWGGKMWDDGVFNRIRQVHVYRSSISNELRGIQFEYEKPDGNLVWSPLHGGNDNSTSSLITIQWVSEEFVGIEGYIGNFINDKNGSDGVKSITLYTNKGKYGPFGVENGKHFMSALTGGKIVGFWGASGTYLNRIGVHMLYV